MLPGPEERFLHNVLGSLPVSVRHPQRVPQQGGSVLRIELTDQRLIADPAPGGLGPRTALTRHILVTATTCSWFIVGVHDRLTGPSAAGEGRQDLDHRSITQGDALGCPGAHLLTVDEERGPG